MFNFGLVFNGLQLLFLAFHILHFNFLALAFHVTLSHLFYPTYLFNAYVFAFGIWNSFTLTKNLYCAHFKNSLFLY